MPANTTATVSTFAEKRSRNEPITVLTAYDYATARLVDEAGVDAVLIGDSLAMVMLGHENTLSVTLDEMVHHMRSVSRAVHKALLIGDLPFMSYQAGIQDAVRSSGRLLKEGGVAAVKLEGGREYADTVRAIVRAGIPVQGHIGLTPQSVNIFGGWKVQGRTAQSASRLVSDALALEDAGCFSLVIESVPDQVATYITGKLTIPTIGIGAGAGTSGQVLVLHDLLGLYTDIRPRFVKRYADLGSAIRQAVCCYRDEVVSRTFPGAEHVYSMPPEEWRQFLAEMGDISGSASHAK
ncbi:MAG TPA: 3-methyl-2-oxobutanoate hydroxymethyltransferase [Bryobacteraceae bacterium]